MSEPTNDGGPAFPSEERDANGQFRQHFGMTLRDYFAGQALNGMLGSRNGGSFISPTDQKIQADMAYGYADAMLKARGGV